MCMCVRSGVGTARVVAEPHVGAQQDAGAAVITRRTAALPRSHSACDHTHPTLYYFINCYMYMCNIIW